MEYIQRNTKQNNPLDPQSIGWLSYFNKKNVSVAFLQTRIQMHIASFPIIAGVTDSLPLIVTYQIKY